MTSTKSARTQMQKIVERTEELSELVTKLSASITSRDDEVEKDPPTSAFSSERIKERQCDDLAWLVGQQGLLEEKQGNFVGVYNHEIVATAPSEHLVRRAAAKKKGVDENEILIVPIKVPGSEMLWEEIEAMMEEV